MNWKIFITRTVENELLITMPDKIEEQIFNCHHLKRAQSMTSRRLMLQYFNGCSFLQHKFIMDIQYLILWYHKIIMDIQN